MVEAQGGFGCGRAAVVLLLAAGLTVLADLADAATTDLRAGLGPDFAGALLNSP